MPGLLCGTVCVVIFLDRNGTSDGQTDRQTETEKHMAIRYTALAQHRVGKTNA